MEWTVYPIATDSSLFFTSPSFPRIQGTMAAIIPVFPKMRYFNVTESLPDRGRCVSENEIPPATTCHGSNTDESLAFHPPFKRLPRVLSFFMHFSNGATEQCNIGFYKDLDHE
jgi:hypothetical protein